jgi:two-component system sensor histidine kinase KdpD
MALAALGAAVAAGAIWRARARARSCGADADRLRLEADRLRVEAARLRNELDRHEVAVADLHRLDLQRSALLRSVTHDLRTPLAAINAVASDLRDGVPYDDATRTELLDLVCDEVARLDRLVANLLTMSRIDAEAFTPRTLPVDLDELVRDRLVTLGPLLRRHRLGVDVPGDLPLVEADVGQLEQVVTNLVANAVRHAPEGSTLEVKAVAEEGGSWVRMSVIDHGPGVDPAVRDRAFEPFVRGAGSRSSGVGLAICAEVVRGHDGRLGIDDTPGGGATVWFALPAASPAQDGVGDESIDGGLGADGETGDGGRSA